MDIKIQRVGGSGYTKTEDKKGRGTSVKERVNNRPRPN